MANGFGIAIAEVEDSKNSTSSNDDRYKSESASESAFSPTKRTKRTKRELNIALSQHFRSQIALRRLKNVDEADEAQHK